jgi:hypothetical protein
MLCLADDSLSCRGRADNIHRPKNEGKWRANCRRNKAETPSVSTETIECKPALSIIIIACIYITPNLPQTIQNKYCIILNSYIWTADCIQRCVQCMCISFRLKLKELIISLPHQYILVVQVRLKTPTQILLVKTFYTVTILLLLVGKPRNQNAY